jgi:hypothetical protein
MPRHHFRYAGPERHPYVAQTEKYAKIESPLLIGQLAKITSAWYYMFREQAKSYVRTVRIFVHFLFCHSVSLAWRWYWSLTLYPCLIDFVVDGGPQWIRGRCVTGCKVGLYLYGWHLSWRVTAVFSLQIDLFF